MKKAYTVPDPVRVGDDMNFYVEGILRSETILNETKFDVYWNG